MATKTKKKGVKVRDLKPSKDAKGGAARLQGATRQGATRQAPARRQHGASGRGN
jgi:hypothetical protein